MSDYGIKPSTYFFGIITTWDEMTVTFKLAFEHKKIHKL
jgi:hypothetical protein